MFFSFHLDNLCTDPSGRKLLPFKAWTIIAKYFPDAVHISAKDSVACLDCKVCQREQIKLELEPVKGIIFMLPLC